MHSILEKTDRVLASYLISLGTAGTADDIYHARRAGDKEALPDTICYSPRARMEPPNSGVYVVTSMIMVRTDPTVDVNETAIEKEGESRVRVLETFDAFMAQVGTGSGQLAAAITAAKEDAGVTHFTVQAVTVISQEQGRDERRNAWIDTLNLELIVFPD